VVFGWIPAQEAGFRRRIVRSAPAGVVVAFDLAAAGPGPQLLTVLNIDLGAALHLAPRHVAFSSHVW